LSLELWKLWRAFGDQVPLFAGGLVDWPDWVLHDFRIIEWQNRMVRHALGLD